MAVPPRPTNNSPVWRVLGLLEGVKQSGSGFQAKCPAHDDRVASLSIGDGDDGRALVHCKAGCQTTDVCNAIGLTVSDLFETNTRRFRVVGGTHTYRHVRKDKPDGDKDIYWETDGKPGLNGMKLEDLPLYGLSSLEGASTSSTVYLCEGEKAAQALIDRGLYAVGTVTGASATPSGAVLAAIGAYHVVLWPDNDVPGREHMQQIAALLNMRRPPSWLEWPDSPVKGDAADYVEQGLPLDGLAEMVRAWKPAEVALVPQPSRLQVIRLSDVQPEAISWLWRGRLARGKATLLMGDPGLGKSLISHWIASTISTGGAWPDEGTCQAGSSILFSTEDGLADTVVPRCLAAGADMARIHAVQGVIEDPNDPIERMFALDEHLADLEVLVGETGAIFVVMDPITAYLGPDVNSHKEADVRRVLGPVSLMAQRTGIVLLMVMHLNKGTGVSALYRSVGSIAFPAVARVVLGIAPDPNDEKRRLLLPVKMNIAADALGIGYRIGTTESRVLRHANQEDQPPVLLWDNEPVTVTAATALDSSGTATDKSMKAAIKTVLLGLLPPGTRKSSRECWDSIKKETGCSSGSVVTQAKTELGVISAREAFSGGWYWEMPEDSLARAYGMTESTESRGILESWGGTDQPIDSVDPFLDSIQPPQDSTQTPKILQDSTFRPSRARETVGRDDDLPTVQRDGEDLAGPAGAGPDAGAGDVYSPREHGGVGDAVADAGAVVRPAGDGPGGHLPKPCPDCGGVTPGSWALYCDTCKARRSALAMSNIEEIPID